MFKRMPVYVGVALVVVSVAASANATTKRAGNAKSSAIAAAPFAESWANVPRTPAARRAKDTLVFGAEQDITGFNVQQADQSALWAQITGVSPTLRGIYIIDQNGNYHLDLATKVTATKTNLTITVRSDAVWNWGGKKLPVTNQDLVYTWQQIVAPANTPASTSGYDQIDSFKLVGTKTVVFHWKKPFADYRDLFGIVLPKAALGDLQFNTFWSDCVCGTDGKPVADGPFLLTNYTRGQGMTLKPNPYWYGKKAGLKELDFKIITDTNSEIQAMRGGEVDAIYPSPQTALAQLKGQPGLTYSSIPGFTQEHVDIEVGPKGHPLLKQKWMRQAITLGINRHSLIAALYGQIAPGLKPLNNLEYELGPNAIPHFAQWASAPGKALALLKAHCTGGPSKPTRNNTAMWTCDGQKAEFRWGTTAGNQRRATSAAIFTQQLGAIGIKLNVQFEPANPNFFGQRLPSGDFDLAEYALSGGPDPSGFDAIYQTGGGGNYKQYSNKTVDALINAGDAELNPTKRTADYEKAAKIMADDITMIPLYSPPNILVYKSGIKGMSNNPTQEGPTWNVEQWHW
jgi:peptide/nickel transport system substrate-binding protein